MGELHSKVPLSQGSAGPVVLLPLRRRAAPFAESRSAQRRRRQRRGWKFLPFDGRTEQQDLWSWRRSLPELRRSRGGHPEHPRSPFTGDVSSTASR